jgi:hypothetical protein
MALPGILVAGLALGLLPATSVAAAPAPCGGIPQITDPSKDGHHPNTDITSAWFSEASGRLQVVMQSFGAEHTAEHTDAETNIAAYVFLFDSGGVTRFVRAQRPAGSPAAVYDYGTYVAPNTFSAAGPTTGEEVSGPGGTFTIDVPAPFGVAGSLLARPFVLTYDGVTGGVPDWVDHAPGGVSPTEASYGADYVAGSCAPVVSTPTGPVPPTAPGGPVAPAGPLTTTAIQLNAPASLKGGGPAKLTGRIVPARAGVPVVLTIAAGLRHVVRRVTSQADGSFGLTVPLKETSTVRAVAEGIGSQTDTVTVHSTVRLSVKRMPGGRYRVSGAVRPVLPGRVLLLRTTSSIPTATTKLTRAGTFAFTLTRPRAGRYQAVAIPSSGRAERSTSNTGVLR